MFKREVFKDSKGDLEVCVVRIWHPNKMENGGWVCPVHMSGVRLENVSVMAGEDPLESFIRALGFLRNLMENSAERFLFGQREMGGIPAFLDRGALPRDQLEIENLARKVTIEKSEKLT